MALKISAASLTLGHFCSSFVFLAISTPRGVSGG
jgi:hypothetical protein